MYGTDYDDFMPQDLWMDRTSQYHKDPAVFHSPAFDDPEIYGYAMSTALFGISLTAIEEPTKEPLTFDSTNLMWNADAATDTLPVPGRYEGLNTMSFADGHGEVIDGRTRGMAGAWRPGRR